MLRARARLRLDRSGVAVSHDACQLVMHVHVHVEKYLRALV
jgi:hypothetical protein